MHCFISTDNGTHYHNSGFLFYLAQANQVFDLTLGEYNNFEARRGSPSSTLILHIEVIRLYVGCELGTTWGQDNSLES